MTRWPLALVAAGLLAGPSAAETQDHLDRLLQGKVAMAPRRCIFADQTVPPEIIDGTAIVYRDARYTYVARFRKGCPVLRQGRRIVTQTTNGRICANDPVHVLETSGHDFGFCTFDAFVPYKKR
jgi:hypothetical protein